MKIFHIANFGYKGPGGIKTVVESLATRQKTFGHSVLVGLTLRHEICDTDEMFVHCPKVKDFKLLIKSDRPDIVIFHGVFNPTFFLFSLLCRLRKIPYCITMHGAGTAASLKDRHRKKKIALWLFVNNFVKHAAGLIFLCEGEVRNNTLAKLNPRHYIIPNGIESVHDITTKKEHSPIRFIFLGRIVYYEKSIDILLKVFALLKKRGDDSKLHFTFYGPRYDGTLIHDIQPYSSFVSWHEPVYGIDKREALADNDIFILVSRSEGMPVGVLEALSCGTPCLVTPQTNMAELITENNAGWVTSLEPADIADSMIKACDECKTRYEELRINALNAINGYTWDEIATKSINTYKQIITLSCSN